MNKPHPSDRKSVRRGKKICKFFFSRWNLFFGESVIVRCYPDNATKPTVLVFLQRIGFLHLNDLIGQLRADNTFYIAIKIHQVCTLSIQIINNNKNRMPKTRTFLFYFRDFEPPVEVEISFYIISGYDIK